MPPPSEEWMAGRKWSPDRSLASAVERILGHGANLSFGRRQPRSQSCNRDVAALEKPRDDTSTSAIAFPAQHETQRAKTTRLASRDAWMDCGGVRACELPCSEARRRAGRLRRGHAGRRRRRRRFLANVGRCPARLVQRQVACPLACQLVSTLARALSPRRLAGLARPRAGPRTRLETEAAAPPRRVGGRTAAEAGRLGRTHPLLPPKLL